MTTNKAFGFNAITKAGSVTGTVVVWVQGPADGLAAVMSRLVPMLKALPGCEVIEVKREPYSAENARQSVAEFTKRCEAYEAATFPAVRTAPDAHRS